MATRDAFAPSLSPQEFQLFDHKRIAELYELEHKREEKRQRDIRKANEEGRPEPEMVDLTEIEKSQVLEREDLESQGFPNWTRNDFIRFTKGCAKHGRDQLVQITEDMQVKTLEEVKAYSAAFWARGPSLLSDFDKHLKQIEEGEKKLDQKREMADALRKKISSCEGDPWRTLTVKYGNNRGKLFTEDEDRFLLCMTNEKSYGAWEELKREVTTALMIS